MGVENTSGTDTRTEKPETPQTRDRPQGPPPDRPGSPGQPSRLESLRAAREAQEARRAETQQTATQEAGAEQSDEREKEKDQSSSAEPTGESPEATADPKDAEKTSETGENDSADASGTDERERETGRFQPEAEQTRPDGRSEQTEATDSGELTPGTGTELRGEAENEGAEPSVAKPTDEKPDAAAEPKTDEGRPEIGETQGAGDETEPPDECAEEPRTRDAGESAPESPHEREQPQAREPEAEDPQNQDHQPLPQQDAQAPGTDDTDAGREPATEHTSPAGDEPTGHEQTPQDEPAPAPTEQQDGSSEHRQPAEGDDQRTPERQSRTTETPEQHDTPTLQVAWPPAAEEGVTRWASPIVRFNERMPGTQVETRDRNAEGQPETPATTDYDPNRYRNLPDPIRTGIADRPDPIPPEDDPADRNPDPEEGRRSRWENYDRVNTAFGATKKIIKGVKDFQTKPPPTGKAESNAGVNSKRPEVQSGNPTDPVTNGIIVAAIVAGGILQTYRTYKSSRRSENAYNR